MGAIDLRSDRHDAVEITVPSGGVVGGAMDLIAGLAGVYFEDGVVGEKVSFIYGARKIMVPKEAATAGPAFAVGAKIYFDDTSKKVDANASGNTLCGRAVEAALALDTTVLIDLTALDSSTTIVPFEAERTLFYIKSGDSLRMYSDFVDFSDDLAMSLNGTTTARSMHARGQYDTDTNVFTAYKIGVYLLEP